MPITVRTPARRLLVLSATIGAVAAIMMSAASVPVSAAPITYTVVDLGTLGGTTSSAYDINNNREVAGQTATGTNADGVWFHWRSHVMLGDSESALMSRGAAVNDIGHVVGSIGPADGSTSSAFTWDTHKTRMLRGLGGQCSYASDISNKEYVVGVSATSGTCLTATHSEAVIWIKRVPTSLGSLVGPSGNSAATALNYKEMITGSSDSSAGHTHAFFYRAGKMWDIGVLPTAVTSQGLDINAIGDVVGVSTFGSGDYHAFFKGRKSNSMIDLGTLGGPDSIAYGIGRSDEVVGASQLVSKGPNHAFLWENGTMTDLNSLIPNGSGWVLSAATAMNDYGVISGYGTFGGNVQAFILVPNK